MRVVNEKFETITEYDLSKGYLMPAMDIKEDAIPVDNITKFAWDEEDYEEIRIYVEYPEKTPEEAVAELREEKLQALLDAVPASDKPSDPPSRPGYKWKLTYTWGNSSMAWEEVEDPDAQGTSDNPIPWEAGMVVYANYFYTADGVRYLCVLAGAPPEITAEYFEQF